MKTLIAACALLGLLINPAMAANEQQNKMAICNKDATGKKGDERKAFMKECLSSKPAAPAATPAAAPSPAPEAAPAAGNSQQNKMATCNKEATGKKGDERKAFMKECLSNKPAAPASASAAPAAAPIAAAPAAGNSQQNKMATCNKEATGKKGDERKQFMSECLKAK
jgi:hypothetical protein